MNRLCSLSLLVASILMSQAVNAKGCADESNTLAIEACYQKEYDAADKELNAVYRNAMKSLEPAAKQKLKDAQKAWLKTRDANIAFMIEQNKDSGTDGGIVVADYKAKVVEKRVLELKAMLQGPESSEHIPEWE